MRVFAAAFHAQIMEEIEKYSQYDLEQLSYRILQQVAKSMSLPSNVKKIYLVQLIHAKTHGTAAELEDIIQKVRHERQLMTQKSSHTKRKAKKRMRLQATEVSSTNTSCVSPPIDLTPKRAYSPEMLRSVVKYGPKNTSDRVLRSYNMKSYKRPNYSMINNSVVELMKLARTSPKKETQISIVSNEGRLPRLNVTARCVVRKLPSPRSYSRCHDQANKANTSASTHTQTSSCMVPIKRARTLSGIYPIPPPETPLKTNYECIQAIGFRHTDGKLSKINAVVQKPAPKITYKTYDFDHKDSYKNVEVTIQDIINSNIDSQTFTNPSVSQYMLTGSNASTQMTLSDVIPNRIIQNSNDMNAFSVYCHKKIRAEQVRSKKNLPSLPAPSRFVLANNFKQRLPYNHTYSRFNVPRHVTKPIYVQVGGEEEKVLSAPPLVRAVLKATANQLPSRTANSDATRDVTKVVTAPLVRTLLKATAIRLPRRRVNCDVTKALTGPLVPTLRKATANRLPSCSDANSDATRDVTKGILMQVTAQLKVLDEMCSNQQVPNQPDSDANCDVTHARRSTDENAISPSLMDSKIGDEERLPVLSDVYSDAARDVTHTTCTANADNITAHSAANDQVLPKLNDVYSDGTPTVDQPAGTQQHTKEQCLPKFSDAFSEASCDVTRVYEQVSDEEKPEEQCLPKFSDAFSEASRDVTRVYEQVSDEEKPLPHTSVPCKMASEMHPPASSAVRSNLSDPRLHARVLHLPLDTNVSGYKDCALEAVYTLKSRAPPRHALAHADCVSVYSTRTVATAVPLSPVPAPPAVHNASFEPASQYATTYGGTSDEVSRLCDMPFAEQDMTLRRYHEAETRSNSSIGSQAPTIPELVEDALEIISQDGDYMERIGMDVRMQCILCSWAGSKIILEYHLRKEHPTQIVQQEKNEWNVTYKLSSVVNQDLWLSHVCDRDSTLYILSVKYEQPDCFMASLTTLSIADTKPKYGTITLYNKVTGEPFSWHGQIPQLPSNMPYENDPNCLRIELSKLNLLPNSANLKLFNKELVLSSPAKVVVGQPELNDIHIIIFVKVYDA